MDIQRLRNLTTGRLHTEMVHIYQDIDRLVGVEGVMTHMIPNVLRALLPYLKGACSDPRLWDGKFDPTHTGEIDVPPMNDQEQAEYWKRFNALPDPLVGKNVIIVES